MRQRRNSGPTPSVARQRGRLGLLLAALVVPCAIAVTSLAPAGAATMTTIRYRPTTPTAASHAELERTAGVLQNRARALGAREASASVSGGEIAVKVPAPVTAAFRAALQAPSVLFFRPVICGAAPYRAPTKGSSAYVTPPTCPPAFRYPTVRRTSGVFNYPNPDPVYATYPSTPAMTDLQHPNDNVILAGEPSPAQRLVLGPAVADGSIIKSCNARLDPTTHQSVVVCELTPEGSSQFNTMARRHFGQMVADDFDGTVLSSPIVEATSYKGSFQLSSNFTESTATNIAVDLSFGALPLPLTAT
jgi:preprotein translocase subunit SecD